MSCVHPLCLQDFTGNCQVSVGRMLEKDKRALTRITSKGDAIEGNSTSSDTKSENGDILPQPDSPSLCRKSTEEELW